MNRDVRQIKQKWGKNLLNHLQFRAGKNGFRGEPGFTLIELMVVIALIGILSTIAAPSWLGFVRQQRVTAVNDEVSLALREAQTKAKSTKLAQSVSVQVTAEGIPQIAVHPKTVAANNLGNAWKNLGSDRGVSGDQILLYTNIKVNNPNQVETVNNDTYPQPKDNNGPVPVTITFDQDGNLDPLTNPKLTIGTPPNEEDKGLIIGVAVPRGSNPALPVDNTRRCMIVRTLLGSMELESGENCEPW